MARSLDRAVFEMLGLARGVIADGVVNTDEAVALRHWQNAHPDLAGAWPVSAVYARLDRIFADGRVDPEERAALLELLQQVAAQREPGSDPGEPSSPDPKDPPETAIDFPGRYFACTGIMACGPWSVLERAVAERGGRLQPSVTERTNFLVLGAYVRLDNPTTYSVDTLQRAVDFRRHGRPIAIVSEDDVTRAMDRSRGQPRVDFTP